MHLARSSETLGALRERLEQVGGSCDKHGAYTTFRLSGTDAATCQQCFEERMQAETAEAKFRARVAHLQDTAGIPERFSRVGFSGYKSTTQAQSDAVQRMTAFMRQVRDDESTPTWRTLLVHGSVGTGKTHLVCATANNLISRGVSVRYTTTQAMLAEIKRAYSTEGMTEASQIERYVRGASLLILDEADVTRGSENDLGLVFAVVNGRYNAGRPMAIVSNQAVENIGQFMGERTASRLMENATLVACDWDDYRRKTA